MDGETTVATIFMQGKEADLQGFSFFTVAVDNPFDGFSARFFWRHTLPHKFHNEVLAHAANDFFSDTCGSGATNFIIHEKSCTNDG